MKKLFGLTEEEYDLVFNTDWNKGIDSEMKALDRARIHDIYLKYLHNFFKEKKEVMEENNVVGFVD